MNSNPLPPRKFRIATIALALVGCISLTVFVPTAAAGKTETPRAGSPEIPRPGAWVPALAAPGADVCPRIAGNFVNVGEEAPTNGYVRQPRTLSESLGFAPPQVPDTVELKLDGTQLNGVFRWEDTTAPEKPFSVAVRCIQGEALVEINLEESSGVGQVIKERKQVRLSPTTDGALVMSYLRSRRTYGGAVADRMYDRRQDVLTWHRFAASTKEPPPPAIQSKEPIPPEVDPAPPEQ